VAGELLLIIAATSSFEFGHWSAQCWSTDDEEAVPFAICASAFLEVSCGAVAGGCDCGDEPDEDRAGGDDPAVENGPPMKLSNPNRSSNDADPFPLPLLVFEALLSVFRFTMLSVGYAEFMS
jgi:hypothetical protein